MQVGDIVVVKNSPYYDLPVGSLVEVVSVTKSGNAYINYGGFNFYLTTKELEYIPEEGPGEEDGPWAEGYDKRASQTVTINIDDQRPKGNPLKSAMNTMVGGSHYKLFPIQPAEFCYRNRKVINNLQSEAISYICRAPLKNGKQDVEKAIHTLQMWLELWEDET